MKWLYLFGALVVAGCAAHAPPRGVRSGAEMRIISLVPSLTEDLCALGAQRQLVGVSQFSDDIPCARGRPEVNNFAAVDAERVIRLHPDIVVGIPAQRAMTAPLRRAGITTKLLRDDTYADLFDDIAVLGNLSGHVQQSKRLISSLRHRTAQLVDNERFARKPTVFFVEQAVPIWTVGRGSYIGDLIALAGGALSTASLARPYAQFSAEALVRLDPDAIIATGDAQLTAVLDSQPWRSLRAVREHHVYVLQNSAVLVRPGPRYNEGLSWLIEHLRPLAT